MGEFGATRLVWGVPGTLTAGRGMTEPIDIVLPSDQSEGTTNTVGTWFKAVGESVALNDPLLEIVTDKVTVEIAAPASGVLVEILKPEGASVEPGDVVGRIGSEAPSGAVTAPTTPTPASPTSSRSSASPATEELSPAVRRLIQERGLDPAMIKGTGRGGRITVQDVEAHLAGMGTSRPPVSPSSRLVPHTAMRKSIAEHMVRSVATAPHVTAVFEADLGGVLAHREAQGKTATLTAYFVRATVQALQAVPEVNSRWHDQGLELFDDCNIGIATALESGGLIVPVLHAAQQLDLDETARRLADLTARARAGRLEPREVQGGTFTISNHGVSGSLFAAPIIINQPQSAILGVGKLEQRIRTDGNGGFAARPMLYVSLTIDHRALDGFQANAFLSAWVGALEQWS
jgi:2-oxoglutarate dehydrogenase E2 component (dihydrolipoamide succinyltransferase)